MQIIDGKKIRDEILEEIKKEIATLSFVPVFCDILVGNDFASTKYVEMKKKIAEKIGIRFHPAFFPNSIQAEELIKEIEKLNTIENMCGIIVQLPLPSHLDRKKILDAIDPRLDVDCLGKIQSEMFYQNKSILGFPTAIASMAVLDSLDIRLSDKKIVVLGQGELVGKPVAALLKFRNLNPEIVNTKTENKEVLIKNADVIISGIGNGKYLTSDMIKKDVIIVDAGTSEENGSLVGDVDLESVKDTVSYVASSPGGVGPVTVAILFRNLLQVAKNLKK